MHNTFSEIIFENMFSHIHFSVKNKFWEFTNLFLIFHKNAFFFEKSHKVKIYQLNNLIKNYPANWTKHRNYVYKLKASNLPSYFLMNYVYSSLSWLRHSFSYWVSFAVSSSCLSLLQWRSFQPLVVDSNKVQVEQEAAELGETNLN